MGKKYDDAIERINGIRENLEVAADDAAKDAPDVVRGTYERTATEVELTLRTAVEAIEGDLRDESDYNVARVIVSAATLHGAIRDLINSL